MSGNILSKNLAPHHLELFRPSVKLHNPDFVKGVEFDPLLLSPDAPVSIAIQGGLGYKSAGSKENEMEKMKTVSEIWIIEGLDKI